MIRESIRLVVIPALMLIAFGVFPPGKNKSSALGPEATLALAAGGKLRGFLTVRYFWETYARTATQGSAFLVQATFLTMPIKLP